MICDKKYFLPLFFLSILYYSCKVTEFPLQQNFPKPVDTSTRPTNQQVKKVYDIGGVKADNTFDGARMNSFTQVNDSTFSVTILPENEPINKSPHFAFALSSETSRDIHLQIDYGEYKHRYYPKLSQDLENWTPIDSMSFDTLMAGNLARLRLTIDTRPLYIAAQEIHDSQHTADWVAALTANYTDVHSGIAGQSTLDRPIHYMDISDGPVEDKPGVLILSRTHPPEISGYMAMEAFVERLLEDDQLSIAFRKKYRVLVYPLINPDGVDLGYWRHNVGGIDLNRDWSTFQQPETKAVARHISTEVDKHNNDIVMGLDFHSTQEDVIYTHTPNRQSQIYPFKDLWIESIEGAGYGPNEEAYDLSTPMTKGWFYLAFGAEAIIYEVGDETDRKYLKEKARFAASEMMKLLVLR